MLSMTDLQEFLVLFFPGLFVDAYFHFCLLTNTWPFTDFYTKTDGALGQKSSSFNHLRFQVLLG